MVSRVKCLPGLSGGWSGVSLISPGRGANVTETLGKLLAASDSPSPSGSSFWAGALRPD